MGREEIIRARDRGGQKRISSEQEIEVGREDIIRARDRGGQRGYHQIIRARDRGGQRGYQSKR